MKSVSVYLQPQTNLDETWNFLELLGLQILYSSEDHDLKVIHANIPDDFDLKTLENSTILKVEPFILPPIDWVQQFENHGLNYHDGYVHVDLKDFGASSPKINPIKIKPGPGFGDLSHPTTNLVLKMMAKLVPGEHVLDIGSGSGVLTLAAISMGALSCFGVDIDEEAISHSNLNKEINGMKDLAAFGLASDYKPLKNQTSLLVLMNMIQSEQKDAWESLKVVHKIPGSCLISGILKKDEQKYLSWAKKLKWKLISKEENDGWMGFHFLR